MTHCFFILIKNEKIESTSLTIKSLSIYPFNIYESLSMDSHRTEPIILNKDYGILAISNTYVSNFIFLKEEKDTIHFKKIKKEILNFHGLNAYFKNN